MPSGGNPNQDLFFSRLRRRQKWVFFALAIIFAVSFVALGVGSGAGSRARGLYNSIFGGGGDTVGKAKAEIKNRIRRRATRILRPPTSRTTTCPARSAR